jgi:hypothetical protein
MRAGVAFVTRRGRCRCNTARVPAAARCADGSRARAALAAAHVPLFWSLDAPVALLALAMAIAWSFPLAWLFDRARGSIWPGAIMHAVMQSGIKLLVDDDAAFQSLVVGWVVLGIGASWLFFLLREPRDRAQLDSTGG